MVNFINFTFSALLSPVFGGRLVEMPEGDMNLALAHYQAGFKPLLYGIVVALILTVFSKGNGTGDQEDMTPIFNFGRQTMCWKSRSF